MHGDAPRLSFNLFSFARQFVQTLSVHFYSRMHRRNLLDGPRKLCNGLFDFAFLDSRFSILRKTNRALRILRRARGAKHKSCLVRLVELYKLIDVFCRLLSNGNNQKSCRKRVERSGVPDFLDAGDAAQFCDDVEARPSRGLVDEEKAEARGAFCRRCHMVERIMFRAS